MIPIVDFTRNKPALGRRGLYLSRRGEGLDLQSREEEMAGSLREEDDGERARLAFRGGEVAATTAAEEPDFRIGEDFVGEFELFCFWIVGGSGGWFCGGRGRRGGGGGRCPTTCVVDEELCCDHLADCGVGGFFVLEVREAEFGCMYDGYFRDVDGDDDLFA